MGKRLRQVADTIHQTVYLSELESNMMSTAYFYRLHDVYQNSTVYLTFPCNRTKRYEHSYGAMELAGEMFFSAITNASEPVQNGFFQDAEKYLESAVAKLLEGKTHPTYCNNSYKALSNCFSPMKNQRIPKLCAEVISDSYKNLKEIEDVALNHYMPPFDHDLAKRKFLYQCLLEAVRIVALFHDVGHPPYSHIMESVLNELYAKCNVPSEEFDEIRSNELINSLRAFREGNDDISCLLSLPQKMSQKLHEQVGLKMLSSAFDDVFQIVFERLKIVNKSKKSTLAVYYIAIAEFCFAILREQTSFFVSLHRIIDGCIDADRMDYIVRDSKGSGVDWGTIPYKRMLESCKMFERNYKNERYYIIAYPKKMAEHIDDLLVTRYKIFSRINYHHRSYKTALILQELVKALALDYLRKNERQLALCPGIADLWNCLSSTMNSGDLYIIQWNDSTLISHLYQTLAEVKSRTHEDYNLTEEEYSIISNMLEEFLLNRKHYYSVFKRQSDFTPIFAEVFKRMEPLIKKVQAYEQDKRSSIGTDNQKKEDADDALKRLDYEKLIGIIKSGDADALSRIFPSKISLKKIIQDILYQYKRNGKISSYLFDENIKRFETGLPNKEDGSDGIYLYESDNNVAIPYNVSALEDQLVRLQNNCLHYISYIDSTEDSKAVIGDIRKEIAERQYEAIEKSAKELYSCLQQE